LKLVLASIGLNKLNEFEKCLKKLYPEELLTKYETVVNSMAVHTTDRKHYKELVSIVTYSHHLARRLEVGASRSMRLTAQVSTS